MAIIKCRECGSDVSTTAAACPKCGAEPAKRTSASTWVIAAVLGTGVLMSVLQQRPATRTASPTIDTKRQEQLHAGGMGAGILRVAMKDPEAFVVNSVMVKPNGATCYKFRAKNSFGAVLPSRAVLAGKVMLLEERDASAFADAWRAECSAPGGDEIADRVNRAIESAKR